MTFRRIFHVALACVAVMAALPALASSSYYQPTPNLTALANYGTASPLVLHAWVQTATVGTSTGAASYTWHSSCPGSPDGATYVAATGVSIGCWVLEGVVTSAAGSLPSDVAFIDVAQSFTKAQRSPPVALTLSGATATPNMTNGQNFSLALTSACPCTFANPSPSPVTGQSGIIEIDQDATGGRTVTWGSSYIAAGNTTAGLTLSTAANAKDFLSYYVVNSTTIVVAIGVQNAAH